MTRALHRRSAFLIACSALALLPAACRERRARQEPAPVYEDDVQALLAERCGRCHAGDAAGGYRVDSYLGVVGCLADAGDVPAVTRGDGGTALLAVLDRDDHAGLLDDAERERVATWIDEGAPLHAQRLHPPGMLDPRSPQWHGKLAARDRFARLIDPDHPEACGRCHAGAPVRPRGVPLPAAQAPDCTDCHRAQGGVLACGTCHGDGAERAAPPRDRCLFGATAVDAHGPHLESTRLRSTPLVCSSCHPAATSALRGTHADGHVDVRFDPALAGEDASFDPRSDRCAVGCHDRGGARPQPTFQQLGRLDCGDCHGAPPKDHFAGPCNHCHAGANAAGNALADVTLHMNGAVDVGAGAGTGCGACHGTGNDPMPRTPGHLLHRSTMLTSSISCAECHTVPETVTSAGHLDRGEITPADVVFGPRARAFGQTPNYDMGVCRNIACHGAGVGEKIERALRWDEPASHRCSGCHGAPPAPPHPQDENCASSICHGNEVRGSTPDLAISADGLAHHIDGTIDLAERP